MCLIFDSFTTRQQAEQFAKSATERFGVRTDVYDSQVESQGVHGGAFPDPDGRLKDIFLFELTPPIVLVERVESPAIAAISPDKTDRQLLKAVRDAIAAGPSVENQIEQMVEQFGGVFPRIPAPIAVALTATAPFFKKARRFLPLLHTRPLFLMALLSFISVSESSTR